MFLHIKTDDIVFVRVFVYASVPRQMWLWIDFYVLIKKIMMSAKFLGWVQVRIYIEMPNAYMCIRDAKS